MELREPFYTVVGVVRDVRGGPDREMVPPVYYLTSQTQGLAPNFLAIRSTMPPDALAAPIRDAVLQVDKATIFPGDVQLTGPV